MTLSIIDYLKTNSSFSSYNKHIGYNYEENKIEDKKNIISIKNSCNIIVNIPYSLHSELPEPCIYFNYPHTFLKSYLYLTDSEYNNNAEYPLKSDIILKRYIKNKVNKLSEKKLIGVNATFCRKLLSDVDFDTDPDKNKYFSKFIDLLLDDKKEGFIIIRCGRNGLCRDTVPYKVPRNSVTQNKRLKKYYVFLMKYDGLFAPYGVTYSY